MGTGGISPEGKIEFSPSLRMVGFVKCTPSVSLTTEPVKINRKTLFLRVSDLDMDVDTKSLEDMDSIDRDSSSYSTLQSDSTLADFHIPVSELPPGIEHDPTDKWIALDDGAGGHAPIAPKAVEQLSNFGLETTMKESMWAPDSRTDKMLKNQKHSEWMRETFKHGSMCLPEPAPADVNEVLVWSGSFQHGLYGSELPAARAAGIINMSAQSLFELMVDSSRVKEYNKMSLGRTDLVTFQSDMDGSGPFGRSVTKVMKSETKPPLVRKKLVFVSVLHAKELDDASGYVIVTRAVHHPEDEASAGGVIKSEILMGVNVIRKIQGAEDSRCLMINVNHVRSPLVPVMVAKRIGATAAISFINDIRALCR